MGSNLIIPAFYKSHFLFIFSNTIFTLFTPPTFNVITDTAWGRRKDQFGNVKRGGDTHPFIQGVLDPPKSPSSQPEHKALTPDGPLVTMD